MRIWISDRWLMCWYEKHVKWRLNRWQISSKLTVHVRLTNDKTHQWSYTRISLTSPSTSLETVQANEPTNRTVNNAKQRPFHKHASVMPAKRNQATRAEASNSSSFVIQIAASVTGYRPHSPTNNSGQANTEHYSIESFQLINRQMILNSWCCRLANMYDLHK